MRRWFALLVAAGLAVGTAQAGKVELKGVHLCCGKCVAAVGSVLKGVDGLTEAKCDQKTKTVTFTTKDDKGTQSALKALGEAGFYSTNATDDGKKVDWNIAAAKAEKADSVTVKSVHVCCGQCEKAINALFKDAKVSYAGAGPTKDVTVSGKGLDKSEVLMTLMKAGFAGKVQ
jgi:copper chaperone CopZ